MLLPTSMLVLFLVGHETSYGWDGFFATTNDRIALDPAILVSTRDNGRRTPVIRRLAE